MNFKVPPNLNHSVLLRVSAFKTQSWCVLFCGFTECVTPTWSSVGDRIVERVLEYASFGF